MGKGNIVLGMARGKVGDVVFYRSLGQQQMRAYVGSNIDAKTDNQLKYRLRLPNVLNAYKALKNPYTFEGARKDTNFYSRFMRANLNRKTINGYYAYITKGDAVANKAVADNYIISQGSLSPFQFNFEMGHVHWPWRLTNPENIEVFPLVYRETVVPLNQGGDRPKFDSANLFGWMCEILLNKGLDVTSGDDVGVTKNLTLCQAFTPDRIFITSADYLTFAINKDPFSSAQSHTEIYLDEPQIRGFVSDDGKWYLIVNISEPDTYNRAHIKLAIGRGFPVFDAPAQYVTTGFFSKVAKDGTLKVSFSQFPELVFYENWDIVSIKRIHSEEGFEEAKESYGGGADIPFTPFEP